jgi:hypothetical protein
MTADFCIIRTAKLKAFGNIGASLAHSYRTRPTANADAGRAGDNKHSHGNPEQVLQAIRERLPAKRRKDAVLAIEYFIGASPAFGSRSPSDQAGYFRDALQWLKDRHGAGNVIGWSVHRDETTPHLVAYVVPLDDSGRLNAKRWTGGRAALSELQTAFSRDVGAHHGLARGIEGSTAKHQPPRRAQPVLAAEVTISADELKPRITRKRVLADDYEKPADVATRITARVRAAHQPVRELALLAYQNARRAREMAQTAQLHAEREKTALAALQAEQEASAAQARELAAWRRLAALAPAEIKAAQQAAASRVAQQQAEQAQAHERAQIEAERARRLADLARVERETAGAAHAFAKHALAAIQKAGGDASKVHWPAVEVAALRESIDQHHQPPAAVLAAIVKHSPGMVEPAQQQQLRAFVESYAVDKAPNRPQARPDDRERGNHDPNGP